jgi:hypothetical protein
VLRRKREDEYRVTGFVDRVAPYGTTTLRVIVSHQADEPDLVTRAATLLAVMPGNQHRETIERILSPHDQERGRRAVDALIDTAFIVEDGRGRIRRVA